MSVYTPEFTYRSFILIVVYFAQPQVFWYRAYDHHHGQSNNISTQYASNEADLYHMHRLHVCPTFCVVAGVVFFSISRVVSEHAGWVWVSHIEDQISRSCPIALLDESAITRSYVVISVPPGQRRNWWTVIVEPWLSYLALSYTQSHALTIQRIKIAIFLHSLLERQNYLFNKNLYTTATDSYSCA